jgi:hypothetical protein
LGHIILLEPELLLEPATKVEVETGSSVAEFCTTVLDCDAMVGASLVLTEMTTVSMTAGELAAASAFLRNVLRAGL